MHKIKKTLVIVPFLFFTLSLCGGCIELYDEARGYDSDQEDFETFMSSTLFFVLIGQEVRVLEDNYDGTVTYTEKYKLNGNIIRQVIYKKCLQGQIYRPLPDNDCRGIGTALDNWGAQLLQFCNQNDDSCVNNLNDLDGSGFSEIYNSCNGETPIMSVPYKYLIFRANNFNQIYTDIPPDGHFWTNHGNFLEKAVYEIPGHPVNDPYTSLTDLKTAKKYVICW